MWALLAKLWDTLSRALNVINTNIDTLDQASTYVNKQVRDAIEQSDVEAAATLRRLQAEATTATA